MGLSVHDPFVDPLGNPLGLSRAGADISPVGTITTRTTGPAANEMEADGRQLLKANYSKLYSAIGDAYSIADFSAGFTAVTLSASSTWVSIAYGNGLFVAISATGLTSVSSDLGATWKAGGTLPAGTWACVRFGNGKFVAVGPTDIMAWSSDGVTWAQRWMPVSSNWSAVAYGGGRFVALGSVSASAYSLDGIIWAAGGGTSVATAARSLAYGNGLFVAVYGSTSNAIAVSSPDGILWTASILPESASWVAVTFGNGLFMAVANSNTKPAISADGINWILGPNSMGGGRNIAFASGWFVVFSGPTDGVVRRSRDGITWLTLMLTRGLTYSASTSGNGSLVAIATGSLSAVRLDIISPSAFNIPKVNALNESTAYIKVT